MTDKLAAFKNAESPLPATQQEWHLYGAGMENLGENGAPSLAAVPACGPDELLVRHDATGLCFSDIKVIRLGEEHPRIYRNMRADPVVLGHEIAMTVVGVGENLRDRYKVGDRFTIQADIFVDGVGYAYGYEIQGGLSQYNVIDQRILNGDDGNYLIPVQPTTGYAESALTEPWACVTAAYQLAYRTGLKPGGVVWFIGGGDSRDYTISAGFDHESHPATVLLSHVGAGFEGWVRARAATLGAAVIDVPDVAAPPVEVVDDIVFLGPPPPKLVEDASRFLADFGVVAILAQQPLAAKVNVDVGRVHYNRWVYVGDTGVDVAQAYAADAGAFSAEKRRSGLVCGRGGADGPHARAAGHSFGCAQDKRDCQRPQHHRLHRCQRYPPARCRGIVRRRCPRLRHRIHLPESDESGGLRGRYGSFPSVRFRRHYRAGPRAARDRRCRYLAGSARRDERVRRRCPGHDRRPRPQRYVSKQTRVIGHSASTIDDLRLMLHLAESGVLSPNRSVAAIGSLSAARDGLQSVADTVYPGKVVIYPQIKDFPLTAVADLKDSLPSVYAKLRHGREWTNEAEAEFLRLMLA